MATSFISQETNHAQSAFQILVLPYRNASDTFEFAVFHRSDFACWQGVAGGGEDDETPGEAARREAFEEAKIPMTCRFLPLQAACTVPVALFRDNASWDPALYVIPQHFFGVDCTGRALILSDEHDAVEWLPYAEAAARFTYDSNRTALWELNRRLRGLGPRGE